MPEELDEAQLFNDLTSDEPAAAETENEASETEENQAEITTDAATETEKPAVDDNAPLVPSWRLREVNEEKRGLADKIAALEAERAQWQRQQAPKQDQPKEDGIDPLLDPKGYAKQVREEIRNELLNERREESLQNAAEKYKDEFAEAYRAAQANIDPALRARMQTSRDPGETLIKWHRENKQRAEIGDDLNAYKARMRDELLKDAEFRKTAMEAWRSEAQPGRPRVELPPTLNGASRAGSRAAVDGDVSDRELFNQIAGHAE